MMLLDEGIRIIESHDGGVDRRIVARHLAAQGFERFLKLTRALVHLRHDGRLPTAREAQRWGHHLLKLLDDTLNEFAKDMDFTARPAIRDDINFLRTDPLARKLLGMLDEFGTGGRYHNLDVMLDGHSSVDSPLDRWSASEMALFDADPKWNQLMQDDPAGFDRRWYPHLAATQTCALQRTARALARAWTLGPAQDEGKRLTGVVGRFLFLTDGALARCPPR